MKTDNCLPFLQNKIQSIGSALFYSLSSSVLKFPTSIVTTLKVDEAGNIWFFINKPGQQLHQFDKEFPARMQFYRKGKGYFLQVAGKAFVVNDPEEINSLVDMDTETRSKALKELVLIRVRINNAELHEYQNNMPKNTLKGWFTRMYNWMFAPGGRPELSLQPSPRLGF
jgi:general stress protein 26